MYKFSLVVVSLLSAAGLAIATPVAEPVSSQHDDIIDSVLATHGAELEPIIEKLGGVLDGLLGDSNKGAPGLSFPPGVAGDGPAPPTSLSDVTGSVPGIPTGL